MPSTLKSTAQEANVAASEKFEVSQIITNLHIKEQDEEQPQEKSVQKEQYPITT